MDPLSDVLRNVRLSGAFFYRVEATSPWSVEADDARTLRPQVMPDAEHLMSYHILLAGRAYGNLPGERPVELAPGDVLVFPHGDAHFMSSEPGWRANIARFGTRPARYPETVRLGHGATPDATFVCGFLGCDRLPFNPLLASLPRRLHAHGMREGAITTFASQVVEETRRGNAGAATVLTRFAELMFIEVLRHHIGTLPPGGRGWLAGLADPVVGGALTRLHAEPARAWTLEALAAQVAVSRSVLAERFARLVGQPPMQYLAAWRMQLAAGMLSGTGAKVAAVAATVGYESEAAFSRAFKKATGHSPGAWRMAMADRRPLTARSVA